MATAEPSLNSSNKLLYFAIANVRGPARARGRVPGEAPEGAGPGGGRRKAEKR